MWSQKEIIIFFLGVEVFHTLTHIIFAISGSLPVKFFSLKWTDKLNLFGIIINALIVVGLYWWLMKLQY